MAEPLPLDAGVTACHVGTRREDVRARGSRIMTRTQVGRLTALHTHLRDPLRPLHYISSPT